MATINQIELRVNLRANNNEKSDQFGRLYAELDRNRTTSKMIINSNLFCILLGLHYLCRK